MIASVSSDAGETRSRSAPRYAATCAACSGAVTSCQSSPSCASRSPVPWYDAASSASAVSTCFGVAPTTRASSARDTGFSATNRTLSTALARPDLISCPSLSRDQDVGEQIALLEIDDAAAVQVEQRDERYDSPSQRGLGAEQLGERHPLALGDDRFDLGRALLHGVALRRRDHALLARARRERQHLGPRGRQRHDLAAARRQLRRAALTMEGA